MGGGGGDGGGGGPSVVTTGFDNSMPQIRNPVDRINVMAGELLQYQVPGRTGFVIFPPRRSPPPERRTCSVDMKRGS